MIEVLAFKTSPMARIRANIPQESLVNLWALW